MKIAGATALVTGANGGIGAAIAERLKELGASVIITGRRKDALQPVADKLGAKMIVADLGKHEDIARMAEEAGDVDIVVANAALPVTDSFLAMDDSFIDMGLDVNLRAPIIMARKFAPAMIAKKRGHIVFISSISGKVGAIGATMYCATKFGMRGFALSLRDELGIDGVGVSTIFPGFIRDAGMFAKSGVQLPAGLGTKTPREVALAVSRSIEKNIGELNVAAFDQVIGAFLAGLSPSFISMIQRRFGGHDVAKKMIAAQRNVR